jgi:hypothetical protein
VRHGGEIDHQRGGPKVVNRGRPAFGTRSQHRLLKLCDGKLPLSLTQWDQSYAGGHQIGDITLDESGQGEASRNALPCRANSKNDGQGRLNVAFAKRGRNPV